MTAGKFTVGNKQKGCWAAKSKKKFCKKKPFQVNCPETCGLCSNVGQTPTSPPSTIPDNAPFECSGSAPNCCMGLTNTCNLRVNELFFAAMHNANSDEDKWNSNHEAPLEEALAAGFRAFYLDVCICDGKVVFCHGTCFWAGTQDPTEVFQNIVDFLDNNPSELVIFNFEMSFGKF